MKKETKNAVIYVRTVTTIKNSIKIQTTASKDFAKANNYNVLKIFTDKEKPDNKIYGPSFNAMIKYCEESNNVDAVIVWKLDILTCDFDDYYWAFKPIFEKNNIKLLSVLEPNDESHEGNLIRNIRFLIADYEQKRNKLSR